MLYKFIVWAFWAKTQSHIASNPISVLTIGAVCGKSLIYSKGDSATTFTMEEVGPHQAATRPHQVDVNLHQAESRGSQYSNPHRSLEQRGGREGSVHTTHTSKSQSRRKSHVSHAKNDRDMQREIDELKRELYHARRRRSSPSSEPSSEERDGASYPTTKSTTINVDTKAHLAKAWGTMP